MPPDKPAANNPGGWDGLMEVKIILDKVVTFFPAIRRRQRVVKPASLSSKIITVLLLVIFLVSSSQQLPVQAAPVNATELSYFIVVNKEGASKPLCLGEISPIRVLVYRGKTVNGVSQAPETITGVKVNGWSHNPNVGQISPRQNITLLASDYPGAAEFVFYADNAGETTITFEATIVTPGWFGANWGAGTKTVTGFVNVRVIPCKFKVEVTSNWNNNVRGKYIATMDELMITADSNGQYDGSAKVNWIGTFMMDTCPKEYAIPSGQANLTGEFNDNGQLTVDLTFLPAPVTFNGECGNLSGTDNFEVSQDPIQINVPSSGGAFAMSQLLTGSGEMGIFDGIVAIVVTPVEDEGTALNMGNNEGRVSLTNFLWGFSKFSKDGLKTLWVLH
jgi:hypothetical protein